MLKTVMLSAYALVGVGLLGSGAVAQSVAPLGVETNVKAYAFDLSQLSLLPGRFNDNQNRTVAYQAVRVITHRSEVPCPTVE